MKIKLDENIPVALEQILGNLGHDVETVLFQLVPVARPPFAIQLQPSSS